MYPTDVTNSQWKVIKDFLDNGRKRRYRLRSVFNALLYLNKTGCQWRMLPKNYPPYRICFYYLRMWTRSGVFERLNTFLVRLRRRLGWKNAEPSVAVIDSQSIKCSEVGIEQVGFDGGKHIKGRKRHLVTDSLGLVLAVAVSTANLHDTKGAVLVLRKLFCNGYRKVKKIIGDGGYRGGLIKWAQRCFEWTVEIAMGLTGQPFKPQPVRWKIERTIAWMNWDRRLSKDYECTTSSAETMIYLSNMQRIFRKF